MAFWASVWARSAPIGFVVSSAVLGGVPCGTETPRSTLEGSGGGQDAACTAASFTSKAQQVVHVLENNHSAWRGITWGISCENDLTPGFLLQSPAGGYWGRSSLPVESKCEPDLNVTPESDFCDHDFHVFKCEPLGPACPGSGICQTVEATKAHKGDKAHGLCVGHADFLWDEMYKVVANAEHHVDITTLQKIDGHFLAALQNAISYLNDRSPPRSGVHVRFLHGLPRLPFEVEPAVLGSLTQKIDHTNVNISISVGMLLEPLRWNHSKIIAADGRHSIVGGINTWADDYLGKDPVHDLWMRVDGVAAADAQNFANWLWSEACALAIAKPDLVASFPQPSVSPCLLSVPINPFVPTKGFTPRGQTRIIAAGTTGGITAAPFGGFDRASDEAIFAMIDAADTTVRISQQDLMSQTVLQHIDEELARHLYQAMLRGVNVYVVLSNTGTDYSSGFTAAEQAKFLRDVIQKGARNSWGVPTMPYFTVDDLLCDRLHIASFRFADPGVWPDDTTRNHAKFLMIDEDMFYVGSQNLYPGGLSEPTFSGLAEFVYIVDDSKAAAKVKTDYWDKLWSYSSNTAVSGSDLPAGACVLTQGKLSCCVSGLTPGCIDRALQDCVCAQVPGCCLGNWDASCVNEVDNLGCGSCASRGYLGSDIAASSAKVDWDEYRVDSNWYGTGFNIGGVHYEKGIFTHAASRVVFPLNGLYSTLTGCVGQDDGDGDCGNGSKVTVWGDGSPLWTSTVGNGPVVCMPPLPVTGVQTLMLVADPLGDIRCDEVEWVNALVR